MEFVLYYVLVGLGFFLGTMVSVFQAGKEFEAGVIKQALMVILTWPRILMTAYKSHADNETIKAAVRDEVDQVIRKIRERNRQKRQDSDGK